MDVVNTVLLGGQCPPNVLDDWGTFLRVMDGLVQHHRHVGARSHLFRMFGRACTRPRHRGAVLRFLERSGMAVGFRDVRNMALGYARCFEQPPSPESGPG